MGYFKRKAEAKAAKEKADIEERNKAARLNYIYESINKIFWS